MSNIENLALLIKNEYTKKIILLTDLIRIEKEISSILILDENGLLIEFSSKIQNNKLIKGFDYSNMKHFINVKIHINPIGLMFIYLIVV